MSERGRESGNFYEDILFLKRFRRMKKVATMNHSIPAKIASHQNRITLRLSYLSWKPKSDILRGTNSSKKGSVLEGLIAKTCQCYDPSAMQKISI